jgi:hypothetical protein
LSRVVHVDADAIIAYNRIMRLSLLLRLPLARLCGRLLTAIRVVIEGKTASLTAYQVMGLLGLFKCFEPYLGLFFLGYILNDFETLCSCFSVFFKL